MAIHSGHVVDRGLVVCVSYSKACNVLAFTLLGTHEYCYYYRWIHPLLRNRDN